FVSARRFRGSLQPIKPAGAPSSAPISSQRDTTIHLSPPTSLSLAKMSTVNRAYLDQRLAAANRCSKEAAMAGAKAAAVAT
uniref:Uncharacterized protein n=1 Tax=Aegilops tauschii subsp. strangulata TaxID=200361 RepID=A0A453QNH0_AEGTS